MSRLQPFPFSVVSSLTIDGGNRRGAQSGDQFGTSVAVGDVTGGTPQDDLIVSADRADEAKNKRNVGKVWVFPGPLPADVTEDVGFLLAKGEKDTGLGNKVAAADLTGSPDTDVVVTDFSEEALVFPGTVSGGMSPAVVLRPDPRLASARAYGTAIAAGDIDGVGGPDLIVGASGATPPGPGVQRFYWRSSRLLVRRSRRRRF